MLMTYDHQVMTDKRNVKKAFWHPSLGPRQEHPPPIMWKQSPLLIARKAQSHKLAGKAKQGCIVDHTTKYGQAITSATKTMPIEEGDLHQGKSIRARNTKTSHWLKGSQQVSQWCGLLDDAIMDMNAVTPKAFNGILNMDSVCRDMLLQG